MSFNQALNPIITILFPFTHSYILKRDYFTLNHHQFADMTDWKLIGVSRLERHGANLGVL